MKILKLLILFVIILSSFESATAQKLEDISHPLSKSLLISVEGGGNYSLTDYENTDLGINIGGAIEYYFPTRGKSIFGLKLSLSQQMLSGYDNNLGLKNPSKI